MIELIDDFMGITDHLQHIKNSDQAKYNYTEYPQGGTDLEGKF